MLLSGWYNTKDLVSLSNLRISTRERSVDSEKLVSSVQATMTTLASIPPSNQTVDVFVIDRYVQFCRFDFLVSVAERQLFAVQPDYA
jgi:hypothetical protein